MIHIPKTCEYTPFMIYAKLAAALALLAALIGLGWYLGSSHWKQQYDALEAQNWQSKAAAETLARKALESQLADLQATTAHNAQVMNDLQQQNDTIGAEHANTVALAARLLGDKTRCAAGASDLSKALDNTAIAAASQARRADQLAELLANAYDESVENADQLDALIKEIQPQL